MGIGKGKTDYLLSLIREGKQMTLGQQLRLTAYLSVPAIMAQISSIAMQYIDASMVGSLGANAAASIGLVSTTTWLFWGCVQPLRRDFPCRWHIVSEPGISWKPKDTPSSSYCHACFQFAVGCWRYLYQRYASSLVGWRRGDMERFVPLLQNIRTIPACLAVELSCRRHVALQWEYARARHAEYNDVLAGCRVQLLPDLSDEACGVVRSSIYRSRCRSGCERCYIGNGIGRTRYRRRNDVVSMPPLAHAEVRRRTGKFSTQTGDIA